MNPWHLATAFGLDILLGDPLSLPHPVRWIGRSVIFIERILRHRFVTRIGERWAGVLLTTVIVGSAYGVTWWLLALAGWIHPVIQGVFVIYLSYTVLAVRSLGDEAQGVLERLERLDLSSARSWLSRIVGRETDQLSESGVIRATVETVAENSSDGIVAPMFYLMLGGPPLAMASNHQVTP